MNYAEAKKIANELNEVVRVAGMVLDQFPRGPFGLTPDAVKNSQEYIDANYTFSVAFSKLRNFNVFYVKTFSKERNAERAAKYNPKE